MPGDLALLRPAFNLTWFCLRPDQRGNQHLTYAAARRYAHPGDKLYWHNGQRWLLMGTVKGPQL